MNEKVDVVIIGGGLTGLGIAYRLVEKGMKNVVVLEKGYIGVGASGRFPGGTVQQLPTLDEITLAKEGVKMLRHLSDELNFNIMFRQKGSLLLAFTEEQVDRLMVSVRLQNILKVKSKFIGPSDVKKIVPMLDADKILGAAFCPTDGIVYPYALLWGYAQAVRRGGGRIRTFTEAREVKVEDGQVRAVVTNEGEIEASTVVNAAGARSADIAKIAGVKLPNEPRRREFLVTETLKPFLGPLVLSLHNGLCLAQAMRGEVICSIPGRKSAPSGDMRSSVEFLERAARAAIEIIPQFRDLKVMRQWVGLYDATPDGKPVLGEVKDVRGFIQANGFCGRGLETSTAAARLLAELIVDGKAPALLESFSIERFAEKESTEGKGAMVDFQIS
ncbi:MAG: NAD(P)/FAD-dependent oxidoreductase [Candidatus Hadarchaeaceae archaeon]